MSNYGRFLAELVSYWPDFFREHEAELLPHGDDRIAIWEAVFTVYLIFNGPHRQTANILRAHYEFGISRLATPEESFFQKHGERLSMHLIALSLPRAEDSSDWEA